MEGESLPASLEFLESWLGYRAGSITFPGFVVAIGYKDTVVFSRAYGLADIELGSAMTTQHLFGVASQSKMFTATAIMQLVEKGRLRLDDYAVECLPWLAGHYDKRFSKITIRQLLSHSAGLLRDGTSTNFWVLEQAFPNPTELRKLTLAADIVFTPNSRLKYSNLGYALLGQIIGTASGQTYQAYIREHIISPLGLKNTFPDFAPALRPRLATAHGLPAQHSRPALEPRAPTKALAPAVGIHTTAEDMCRFAATHFFGDERIISDESKLEMQRGQWVLTNGYDSGTELGLGLEAIQVDGHRLIGHTGHLAGYITATYFDPTARLAVSVMTNARDAPNMQMVRGIFGVLGWFAQHADRPAPKSLARFSTRLRNATSAVEIVAAKRGIAAISPDDWQPFAWPERLEKVDARSLRITTSSSIFNEGELLRYTFTHDVVRAVCYAGLTMLPELEYRRQVDGLEPCDDFEHTLTLDDLQYNDLRIGHIIKAEAVTGPLPCRLLVNFGSELGTKYAYMPRLPRETIMESLVGQAVLGAVFPVWRSGARMNDVLVIGFENRGRTGAPLSPGSRYMLLPDPAYPRTLWRAAASRRYRQYVRELRQGTFKLHALPEYPVEEMDFPVPSLAAWLQGKERKALALLKRYDEDPPFWLRASNRHTRVVIMHESPTPYIDWYLEFSRRVAIPMGETIYTLPKKYVAATNLPDGDFTIWDDRRATVNGYVRGHWTHAMLYDADEGNEIGEFLKLKNDLLHLAMTKGQKLQ